MAGPYLAELDKLKTRIQALRAKTIGNGCTEDEALSAAAKVAAVGVSAGACSAVELALRHPDKVAALVLVVPGTYSPISPVSIQASRGSRLAFWLVNNGADFAWSILERIAPSWLIRFIGVPPKLVAAAADTEKARVMRIVRSIRPLSRRFPGIRIDSHPDLHPLRLGAIVAPTLVISAKDDLFNTAPAAEYAASMIKGAKLILFETGGHLLVGRQQEVRTAVHALLTEAHLISSLPAAA